MTSVRTRAIIYVLLAASTAMAQNPPSAQPGAQPAKTETTKKHHKARTILVVVGAAAAASAAAVLATHKGSGPTHCNGPNPNVCAP